MPAGKKTKTKKATPRRARAPSQGGQQMDLPPRPSSALSNPLVYLFGLSLVAMPAYAVYIYTRKGKRGGDTYTKSGTGGGGGTEGPTTESPGTDGSDTGAPTVIETGGFQPTERESNVFLSFSLILSLVFIMRFRRRLLIGFVLHLLFAGLSWAFYTNTGRETRWLVTGIVFLLIAAVYAVMTILMFSRLGLPAVSGAIRGLVSGKPGESRGNQEQRLRLEGARGVAGKRGAYIEKFRIWVMPRSTNPAQSTTSVSLGKYYDRFHHNVKEGDEVSRHAFSDGKYHYVVFGQKNFSDARDRLKRAFGKIQGLKNAELVKTVGSGFHHVKDDFPEER